MRQKITYLKSFRGRGAEAASCASSARSSVSYFVKLNAKGLPVHWVRAGEEKLLILKCAYRVMTATMAPGYLESLAQWRKAPPSSVLLIEGRPSDGALVFRCDAFDGEITEQELGGERAPVVGTLRWSGSAWSVRGQDVAEGRSAA